MCNLGSCRDQIMVLGPLIPAGHTPVPYRVLCFCCFSHALSILLLLLPCSGCKTAGLSVLCYQLKKEQQIQRYLRSSHSSVLSYDLWRKGHWAWSSGSCWLNYSVVCTEKTQSWHIQKQLQLNQEILIWTSCIQPLHICRTLLATCSK